MLETYCHDESFDPPFLPAASGMVFQSFMSSSIVFLFYSHFSSLTFQPLTLIFQFEPKIKLQNIQKHFKLPLSDYWSHYHCMGSWLLFTKLPWYYWSLYNSQHEGKEQAKGTVTPSGQWVKPDWAKNNTTSQGGMQYISFRPATAAKLKKDS